MNTCLNGPRTLMGDWNDSHKITYDLFQEFSQSLAAIQEKGFDIKVRNISGELLEGKSIFGSVGHEVSCFKVTYISCLTLLSPTNNLYSSLLLKIKLIKDLYVSSTMLFEDMNRAWDKIAAVMNKEFMDKFGTQFDDIRKHVNNAMDILNPTFEKIEMMQNKADECLKLNSECMNCRMIVNSSPFE